MKKSCKKSSPAIHPFSKFSAVALSKVQQQKVKGGDDGIIVVEVIEG
ncbi:MAG: hypothetical protein AAGG75_06025 [Bacteroidota bacterium]